MITLAKLASIATASGARTRACHENLNRIHRFCASAVETRTSWPSAVYAILICRQILIPFTRSRARGLWRAREAGPGTWPGSQHAPAALPVGSRFANWREVSVLWVRESILRNVHSTSRQRRVDLSSKLQKGTMPFMTMKLLNSVITACMPEATGGHAL